jgi:hypothetical protein
MVWQEREIAGCCSAPYQVERKKIFPRVDKAALTPVLFGSVQQSMYAPLPLPFQPPIEMSYCIAIQM